MKLFNKRTQFLIYQCKFLLYILGIVFAILIAVCKYLIDIQTAPTRELIRTNRNYTLQLITNNKEEIIIIKEQATYLKEEIKFFKEEIMRELRREDEKNTKLAHSFYRELKKH